MSASGHDEPADVPTTALADQLGRAHAAISLDEWERAHRTRIDSLLAERGFAD